MIAKIIAHSIDYLAGNLCATWTVEVGDGLASVLSCEGREMGADNIDGREGEFL
jgi:hypothetical protein